MLPVMATETELLILLFQVVQHHMILAGLDQQTDLKMMPLMFQEEVIKLQGSQEVITMLQLLTITGVF